MPFTRRGSFLRDTQRRFASFAIPGHPPPGRCTVRVRVSSAVFARPVARDNILILLEMLPILRRISLFSPFRDIREIFTKRMEVSWDNS